MHLLQFIQETCEQVKDASLQSRVDHIVHQLYGRYIRCNYDPVADTNSRMLLWTNRHNMDELAADCNGFIIDYESLEPLCVGPELPTLKWNMQVLRSNFTKYRVWKIYDGTILNLYWYKDRWVLSTTRGYDVAKYKWNGDGITFGKAFEDVQAHYQFDPQNLDKKQCYTIGISHPDMHPYSTGVSAWAVCSYDFQTGQRNYDPSIGIPKSEELHFSSWQEVQQYLHTDNFGVIMRSNDPESTLGNNTVLLESNLMKNIRRHVYDNNYVENAKACQISWSTYVLLHNFLDSNLHDRFQRLFPRYNDDFSCLAQILDETVNRLAKPLQNPSDFEQQLIKEFHKHGSTPYKMSRANIKSFITKTDFIHLWDRRWQEFKATNALGEKLSATTIEDASQTSNDTNSKVDNEANSTGAETNTETDTESKSADSENSTQEPTQSTGSAEATKKIGEVGGCGKSARDGEGENAEHLKKEIQTA